MEFILEALYFTEYFKNKELMNIYQEKISPLGCRAFFNPSMYIEKDLSLFTVRGVRRNPTAKQRGNFNMLSWLVKNDEVICLDEFWPQVKRVYDAKIFHFFDGIYITFNTANEKDNSVYVAKIHPKLESPIELKFTGRNSIEKNWAFYEFKGDRYCLYSINPLVILRDRGGWNFEEYFRGQKDVGIKNDLHIGTQFIPFDNKYMFISHEQVRHEKKIFYMGKFMIFDHEKRKVFMGNKNWCHNIISSTDFYMGRKLWGVTYFSGIQKCENTINVSYGINDRDWAVSSIPIDKIGIDKGE